MISRELGALSTALLGGIDVATEALLLVGLLCAQ